MSKILIKADTNNLKVGDVVAFNMTQDPTWFDVVGIDGFRLVVREHGTNYAVQTIDKSCVKQVRPETEKVIVRRALGGAWKVLVFKPAGINKGTNVIATLCGGNMGKTLAQLVATQVASQMMISDIELIDDRAEGDEA
jgi:hypothetical protein